MCSPGPAPSFLPVRLEGSNPSLKHAVQSLRHSAEPSPEGSSLLTTETSSEAFSQGAPSQLSGTSPLSQPPPPSQDQREVLKESSRGGLYLFTLLFLTHSFRFLHRNSSTTVRQSRILCRQDPSSFLRPTSSPQSCDSQMFSYQPRPHDTRRPQSLL